MKENIEKKLNGMIRILGQHGNFNRIEFGNALWNSVIRPSIAHGCAIWFTSSQTQSNLLQSLQYKAAKIILKTKMNIPINATLIELGWEPINNFLDRQRIAYFSRFSNLPSSRLCKQVYEELSNSNHSAQEWPYFKYVKSVFEGVGLDHFIQGNFSLKTFNKFFGSISREEQFVDINKKTTLNLYSTLNIRGGTQNYLINLNNFDSSRLKFLARTNCLPINSVLFRMKARSNAKCDMCQSNAEEDLKHVLLDCPFYTELRTNMITSITELLYKANSNIDFTGLSPVDKIRFLIGDLGYILSEIVGNDVDIKCKEYLSDVFEKRSQVVCINQSYAVI